MEVPWKSHGIFMEARQWHGNPIEIPWKSHASLIGEQVSHMTTIVPWTCRERTAYRSRMAFPWRFHGSSMEALQYHGSPVEVPWKSHISPVVCPTGTLQSSGSPAGAPWEHCSTMELLWEPRRKVMEVPWKPHAISMRTLQ